MQIIYWEEEDWISDPEKLRYQDKNSSLLLKEMLSAYRTKTPMLNSIEIETGNRCNNDCSFCPVSKENDIRRPLRMPEPLFYKIIDELSKEKYQGYLSLFSNNEPLMDTRIFDFLEYARKKLPDAKHAMYTNGLLLDPEKYVKLVSLLDYLVIDNYDDGMQLLDSVKELAGIKLPEASSCRVRVEVRKKHQILSNRGGIAPNKRHRACYQSGCILPFMQMVIRPDGKVSKCCQDAYGRSTVADVSISGVKKAWEGKEYAKLRKTMLQEGRNGVEGCEACDLFGLHNYFPLSWMHAYTDAFLKLLLQKREEGRKLLIYPGLTDSSKILQLLSFHGIFADGIIDGLEEIRENEFIIFCNYEWDELMKYLPEEAGEKFIVFEDPGSFLLQAPETEAEELDFRKIFQLLKKAETEQRLILFGAGRNAMRLQKLYGLDAACFMDNEEKKLGQEFLGKRIQGPERQQLEQALILVCAKEFLPIQTQLLEMGMEKEQILNGNRLLYP